MSGGGEGWGAALRSLAFRCVALFLLGAVVSGALYLAAERGPIAAMRDALVSAHMAAQAYDLPPPESPAAIRLVAFDEVFCRGARSATETGCVPDGPIDRGRIADVLLLAPLAQPDAILLDVAPLAVGDGCAPGDPTRDLIRAILDVSRTVPLILPRNILGSGAVRSDGPTFLDQCPDALTPEERVELARGEGLFFGHFQLSRSGARMPVDLIHPYLIADVEQAAADGAAVSGMLVRRRVPAVSLIAAMATQVDGPAALLAQFQQAGLETRWRAFAAPPDEPAPLRFCTEGQASCTLAARDLRELPEPLRLSFRFGTPPSQDERRERLFSITSAGEFHERAAEDWARDPPAEHWLLLVAATLPEYGDERDTAIGRMPGGVVHANAFFDFLDDGFLRAPERTEAYLHDLVHFLGFTVVIALVVLAAVFGIRLLRPPARRPSPGRALEWAWPVMLLLLAGAEAWYIWISMHNDFSRGIFSYAIVGAIVALFELRVAVEDLVHAASRQLSEWLARRSRHAGAAPAAGEPPAVPGGPIDVVRRVEP